MARETMIGKLTGLTVLMSLITLGAAAVQAGKWTVAIFGMWVATFAVIVLQLGVL
jgi:hypothetical protein